MRIGPIDFALANAARRIIEGALGIVTGERVVLIVDAERRDLGATLLEVSRAVGADTELFELEICGPRPARRLPDVLHAALSRAQASLLLVGFEEGEIPMRIELTSLVKTLGLRHAHMVGVTRRSMLAGFSVDTSRILDATRAVRTRMRPDSVLRLRTPAGSDLEVKLGPAGRGAEHVGVIRPGRWENLPTGEIVTTPLGIDGVFVADASVGAHFGQAAGLLTDRPLRFEVEGGWMKAVRCVDLSLQRNVESFLRSEHNGARVGVVSLGTNVGIYAPSGDIMCDQNLPGLHLGFGSSFPDQTGASWNARSQLTVTCANADVDLDGVPLLRHGRYMIT